MMRHLIYIFTLVLGLTACQNDDVVVPIQRGYVVLGDISLNDVPVISTRAVETDLNIEIVNVDGQTVKAFAAGDVLAERKIELEAGTYTLHAYTSNIQTEYTEELGVGKYDGTADFTIKPDQTCYVSLSVPMVNAGIKFSLPQDYSVWFGTYIFSVTIGSRSLQLTDGQTAYFDVAGSEVEAKYSFSTTNADNEQMSKAGNLTITAGNVYTIDFALEQ